MDQLFSHVFLVCLLRKRKEKSFDHYPCGYFNELRVLEMGCKR